MNYKNTSQTTPKDTKEIPSRKCQRCSLCGNFGKSKNMVIDEPYIVDKNGKKTKLKYHLTCANYGIYAAQCRICKHFYVGQSKNKFSTRWNAHRNKWKNLCNGKEAIKEGKDEAALYKHYKQHHTEVPLSELDITDAFGVIFLEQPQFKMLDIKESYWISKLMASINVAATILPKYR